MFKMCNKHIFNTKPFNTPTDKINFIFLESIALFWVLKHLSFLLFIFYVPLPIIFIMLFRKEFTVI